MSSAGKYFPSFLLSLGVHGGFLLSIGVVLSVTGGPRHQSVEMDVVRASQAAMPSEPEAAPPPPPDRPVRVRARRSPRASPEPAPPTPAPVIDTGPPAPNAADTAMSASPAPPPGGSEDGVLGGSTAPEARPPGEGATGAPPPPPPERRVYDMADLDSPPTLAGNCTAEVPAFARQTNQSGWVMVQFTLDADGRVSNPRVRASSPPGVFDQSALDAIRRCRYTPPRVGGRAVSVTFRQRLRFEP